MQYRQKHHTIKSVYLRAKLCTWKLNHRAEEAWLDWHSFSQMFVIIVEQPMSVGLKTQELLFCTSCGLIWYETAESYSLTKAIQIQARCIFVRKITRYLIYWLSLNIFAKKAFYNRLCYSFIFVRPWISTLETGKKRDREENKIKSCSAAMNIYVIWHLEVIFFSWRKTG